MAHLFADGNGRAEREKRMSWEKGETRAVSLRSWEELRRCACVPDTGAGLVRLWQQGGSQGT